MTIKHHEMNVEANATEAEIARAKRLYSASECETTIGAWGRYSSQYTIVRVAERHFIVRFTRPDGAGVWGAVDRGYWGDVYLEKRAAA